MFRVEVAGKEGLQPTRMEFRRRGARKRCGFLSWARMNAAPGPMKDRTLRGLDGEYYSVDGYHLTNGLRAAIGAGD